MLEKRKDKRFDVSMHLEISSLFKQDNVKVQNVESPIDVVNISKSGIGFTSSSSLPIGYYFNSCIQLGGEDAKLFCVVKIIRSETLEDGRVMYGSEFVGLAPVFSYIFENYEKSLNIPSE